MPNGNHDAVAEDLPTNPYDIAYEMLHRMSAVEEAVAKIKTDEQMMIWRGSGQVAVAATTVDVILPVSGMTRPGFQYRLKRISCTATARAGSELTIYEQAVDPLNLLEEITAPTRYADAFNNDIWVPGNTPVISHFTGLQAGDVVTVRIQVERTPQLPHRAHYDTQEG